MYLFLPRAELLIVNVRISNLNMKLNNLKCLSLIMTIVSSFLSAGVISAILSKFGKLASCVDLL